MRKIAQQTNYRRGLLLCKFAYFPCRPIQTIFVLEQTTCCVDNKSDISKSGAHLAKALSCGENFLTTAKILHVRTLR